MATLASLLDLMGEELELSAREIDYGHDRTLLQANLRLAPHERIERSAARGKSVRELQRAARR